MHAIYSLWSFFHSPGGPICFMPHQLHLLCPQRPPADLHPRCQEATPSSQSAMVTPESWLPPVTPSSAGHLWYQCRPGRLHWVHAWMYHHWQTILHVWCRAEHELQPWKVNEPLNSLVQHRSNSSADALQLLLCCALPLIKLIEAETKWSPFRRWHLEMHFLEWKCINFDYDFIECCSYGSNNISALVQIMVWRWPGDKPLSEPMMVSLPMHICITQTVSMS